MICDAHLQLEAVNERIYLPVRCFCPKLAVSFVTDTMVNLLYRYLCMISLDI